MTKKAKRNLILVILGAIFLLIGITLIVMYLNRNNFSKNMINFLDVIHEKIVLDYVLIILGTIVVTIPIFAKFFSSAYNLSEIKTKKAESNDNDKSEQIEKLEAKIKVLEKEKNKLLNSKASQTDGQQEV